MGERPGLRAHRRGQALRRRVIGWAFASNLRAADPALAALRMALRHHRPPRGLLHHSDRGVQCACADHRALLAAAGIEPSMGRPGNPGNPDDMESWMATYKRECVALAEEAGLGFADRFGDAGRNQLHERNEPSEREHNTEEETAPELRRGRLR